MIPNTTPWTHPCSRPIARESGELAGTKHPAYVLDDDRRRVVLTAILEVWTQRKWNLHAAHVRAHHVHVVVTGEQTLERMMNDFKAYASRSLNRAGFDDPARKPWTRHGS